MKKSNATTEINTIDSTIKLLQKNLGELTKQSQDFSNYISKNNNPQEIANAKKFLQEKKQEMDEITNTLNSLNAYKDQLANATESNNTEDIARIISEVRNITKKYQNNTCDNKKDNSAQILESKLKKVLSKIDLLNSKSKNIASKLNEQKDILEKSNIINLQSVEILQTDIYALNLEATNLSKTIEKYKDHANSFSKSQNLLELIKKANSKLKKVNLEITDLSKILKAQIKLSTAISEIGLIDNHIQSFESKLKAQKNELQELNTLNLQSAETLQTDIHNIQLKAENLSRRIEKYQNSAINFSKKEYILDLVRKAKNQIESTHTEITQLSKVLKAQIKLNKVLNAIDLTNKQVFAISAQLNDKENEKQDDSTIDLPSAQSLQGDIHNISLKIEHLLKTIEKYQDSAINFSKKEYILDLILKARTTVKTLNIQAIELNKDISELVNSLLDKEKINDKSHESDGRLAKLQSDMRQLTKLYEEAKLAKQTLGLELEDLKIQHSTLFEKVNITNLEMQHNNKLLETKNAEIEKLLDNLHKEQLSHTQAVELLTLEKEQIYKSKTDIESKLSSLQHDLESKNNDYIRLQTEKEGLSEELKKLTIHYQAKVTKDILLSAILERTEKELAEAHNKEKELQEKLSQQDVINKDNINKTKELESELESIKTEKNSLVTKIDELKTDNISVTKEIDHVKAISDNTQKLLHAKTIEAKNLSRSLSYEKTIYEKNIKDLTQEKCELIERYQMLENGLKELQLKLWKTNEQYSKLEREKDNISEELTILKMHYDNGAKKLKETAIGNEILKKEIFQYESCVQRKDQEILKLKEKLEDVCTKIKERTIQLDNNDGLIAANNQYQLVTIEPENKSIAQKALGVLWYSCCGIIAGPVHAFKSLFSKENTISYSIQDTYSPKDIEFVLIEKDDCVILGNSDAPD
jgi:chromosome segregation ATPase